MEEKIQILKLAFGRSWKNNSEYLFSCPKCKHHKLKLSINIEKDAYKCWVCDYSGNKISTLFRKHAPEYSADWNKASGYVDLTEYDSIFQARPATQCSIGLPQNFKTLTGPPNQLNKKALRYLSHRGIAKEEILKWKMGYCNYGEYENRIIIPSFDTCGKLNYFIARDYTEKSFKYKNPNASKDVIFNDLNIDWDDDLVIVEGVFDAIKCKNAIPLLGSTLNEGSKLFEKICNLRPHVYFALDTDAKHKELEIIKKLLEYDIMTYSIEIAPYNDVGEMTSQQFAQRKVNADFISNLDYLKYKLNF